MQTTLACTNGHSKPLVIPQGPATLPEATISLNCYVETPALGKVQVTARGFTEREAVQHLLCAAEELRQQTQPQGPAPAPSREAQVAALLSKGLACAVNKQDWALCERLGKAATLVLSDALQPTDSPAVMACRSQQAPDTWYEISGGVCSCKDSQRHIQAGERYHCKHALSVEMHKRLM